MQILKMPAETSDVLQSAALLPTETNSKAFGGIGSNPVRAEVSVYGVGSAAGHIMVAALIIAFACLCLFLVNPVSLILSIILLCAAWRVLCTPHLLHIGPGWAEFISVIGTEKAHADELHGIVRYEVPTRKLFIPLFRKALPACKLHHLEVQLDRGSITLYTDREDIFKALNRMNPAMRVSRKEYDPD